MQIFYNIAAYKAWHAKLKSKHASIGFVATMGALHQGHLSLIASANQENECSVCSIYVNPTQFNDSGDYEKYPRILDDDIAALEKQNCDVLFAPESGEMYPANEEEAPRSKLNLGVLAEVMEGEFRPGHFDGVVTIVEKLFRIIQPQRAYFGEKDYQQLAVIRKMNQEFGLPIEIIGCPTIRENDGLAMSSRNLLLSSAERTEASAIYRLLVKSKEQLKNLEVQQIKQRLIDDINRFETLDVEYIEIADAQTLKPIDSWDSAESAVCCVAVLSGNVRLIDNIMLYN
ncbi:MAG: pantoate--beta-alanine ligase [Flavobacteriales bacterium]|nr:pantoate--beta-alanine ligase [Flavobacteriales bacterium]